MKNKKIKSVIALVTSLTTVLAVSIATFAAWNYNHDTYDVGSTSAQLCVGYQIYVPDEYIGYAEVTTTSPVYASMDGYAVYRQDGVNRRNLFIGSFDDDTYGQVAVRCINQIQEIKCEFTIVSDDGRIVKTLER